jgi:hypothetical protein
MIASLQKKGLAPPRAPFTEEFIGSRGKPGNDALERE